jgi:hypothetical protein
LQIVQFLVSYTKMHPDNVNSNSSVQRMSLQYVTKPPNVFVLHKFYVILIVAYTTEKAYRYSLK